MSTSGKTAWTKNKWRKNARRRGHKGSHLVTASDIDGTAKAVITRRKIFLTLSKFSTTASNFNWWLISPKEVKTLKKYWRNHEYRQFSSGFCLSLLKLFPLLILFLSLFILFGTWEIWKKSGLNAAHIPPTNSTRTAVRTCHSQSPRGGREQA